MDYHSKREINVVVGVSSVVLRFELMNIKSQIYSLISRIDYDE